MVVNFLRCFSLLVIFSNAGPLVAQIIQYQARLVNTENGEPIPFVNVGVKGKSVGTVADEAGKVDFILDAGSVSDADSVIISSIGYKKLILTKVDFLSRNNSVIRMEPVTMVLSPVTIRKSAMKPKKIGKASHGALTHVMIYGVRDSLDDGLSQEFGSILTLKSACLIDQYQVYFSSNSFTEVLLRLNVYRLDEKDSLKAVILPDNYLFRSAGTGWAVLDLSEETLFLEEGRYAFTSQIIRTEIEPGKQAGLAIPMATPSPFHGWVYRDKNQSYWNRNNSANPSIYIHAFCEE